MWVLVGDHWLFSEPYALSGIVDQLGLPVYGLLLKVGCEEDSFSPDPAALVFIIPSSRCSRLITPDDDKHLKVSKVMSSLVEMRTRYNSLYKGCGTEIGRSQWGRDEWEFPKPRVACRWSLHFHTPIKLDGHYPRMKGSESVPNGFLLCRQWLWVVEKSHSILKFPGYKSRKKTW